MLFVWVAYLFTAGINGLNIGVRHVLPVYALAAVIAGAGVAALVPLERSWKWTCGVLIAAHVFSSLAANTYKVLANSNVDWGQQLYQVKDWENRHPGEECWFAYMVRPIMVQETYGIHCHVLPTDSPWISDSLEARRCRPSCMVRYC